MKLMRILLDEQRYLAFADAAKRVAFQISRNWCHGTIGKLDLAWRIHKNRGQLKSSVLQTEVQRKRQLVGNYKQINAELDKPKQAVEISLSEAVSGTVG